MTGSIFPEDKIERLFFIVGVLIGAIFLWLILLTIGIAIHIRT